jgi:hypothetical protein
MTNDPARQPDGDGEYLRAAGEPTLLVNDHVSDREHRYREQLKQVEDREIKDLLAKIERTAVERRFPKPVSPEQQALESAQGAAWIAEAKARREEPARLAQQQAELEAWANDPATMAAARPDPPPPTRYGKALSPAEVLYEQQLEAAQTKAQAAALAAGCGTCWHCQTGQRCVYRVGS